MNFSEFLLAEPRVSDFSQSPTITLFLLVAFLFLCLFLSNNRHYIQDTVQLVFASRKRNFIVYEEQSVSALLFKLCGYFVAIISVAGFVLLAEQQLNSIIFSCSDAGFEAHFGRCWIVLAAVFAWFLFKLLTFRIWSTTLSTDETVDIFKRTYFSIFIFCGTLLYPFLLIAVFAPFRWQTPAIVAMFVIVCISVVCVIFKLFQYFFARRNNLFYIFLYLCGLEIIPILLLRKLVFLLFEIVLI